MKVTMSDKQNRNKDRQILHLGGIIPFQEKRTNMTRTIIHTPCPIIKKVKIGLPFEIRIPKDQISFLEMEIQKLKSRLNALQLLKQDKNINQEIEQISFSTRKLENQIESAISENTFIECSKSEKHEDGGENEVFQEIMKDLEQTYSDLTQKEEINHSLNSKLSEISDQNLELQQLCKDLCLKIDQKLNV